MRTVFMFSGQGAQYAGMGKELYQKYSAAKKIFDCADEVLGYSIKDICFQDEAKLGETEFAQPAILTMSIAALEVLKEQGVRAEMTAGLSLGEYSAYVASGAMNFEEAVALVQKRGKFMAEAVPSGEGAMYAIIGLDTELVEKACEEAVEEGLGLAVPANYNAPGQIVIAGAAKAVEKAAKLAKEKGAKMAVRLKVSGPFHTKMLQPAADRLEPELKKMHIEPMK
ncbi:MAG TPA: [acyl-carrier-protein] S-malonyltransferase, partial [Lachnospiraceae bacterium]|nr:[acyl-carrier-protein] S-malonyltransferase [Lachnospiraceae bacterium]